MRDEYNKETKKRKSLPTPNRKLGSRIRALKTRALKTRVLKTRALKDTSPNVYES